MSKSNIKIGDIFESNYCGKYEILEHIGSDINRRYKFIINFIDTGFITTTTSDLIKSGQIKDYFYKNVCGVGFLGCNTKIFNDKQFFKRAYNNWKNIISRCYNKNDPNYMKYGYKGTYVDYRWHNFSVFYNDIQLISGFDRERYIKSEIELDKDIKQIKSDSKVYSFKTCLFVEVNINRGYRSLVMNKNILAISPNNEKIIFNNINKFAKDNNLTSPNIHNCMNTNKTHKGWSFKTIM